MEDPMETIEVFIDNLLIEQGLDDIDPDMVDELKADWGSKIEEMINERAGSLLPADKLAEFEELLGVGDVLAAGDFLAENVPNWTLELENILEDFKSNNLDL